MLLARQVYTESTDGSNVEAKESALVWHYRDADPDFGHWQVRPSKHNTLFVVFLLSYYSVSAQQV